MYCTALKALYFKHTRSQFLAAMTKDINTTMFWRSCCTELLSVLWIRSCRTCRFLCYVVSIKLNYCIFWLNTMIAILGYEMKVVVLI